MVERAGWAGTRENIKLIHSVPVFVGVLCNIFN